MTAVFFYGHARQHTGQAPKIRSVSVTIWSCRHVQLRDAFHDPTPTFVGCGPPLGKGLTPLAGRLGLIAVAQALGRCRLFNLKSRELRYFVRQYVRFETAVCFPFGRGDMALHVVTCSNIHVNASGLSLEKMTPRVVWPYPIVIHAEFPDPIGQPLTDLVVLRITFGAATMSRRVVKQRAFPSRLNKVQESLVNEVRVDGDKSWIPVLCRSSLWRDPDQGVPIVNLDIFFA